MTVTFILDPTGQRVAVICGSDGREVTRGPAGVFARAMQLGAAARGELLPAGAEGSAIVTIAAGPRHTLN